MSMKDKETKTVDTTATVPTKTKKRGRPTKSTLKITDQIKEDQPTPVERIYSAIDTLHEAARVAKRIEADQAKLPRELEIRKLAVGAVTDLPVDIDPESMQQILNAQRAILENELPRTEPVVDKPTRLWQVTPEQEDERTIIMTDKDNHTYGLNYEAHHAHGEQLNEEARAKVKEMALANERAAHVSVVLENLHWSCGRLRDTLLDYAPDYIDSVDNLDRVQQLMISIKQQLVWKLDSFDSTVFDVLSCACIIPALGYIGPQRTDTLLRMAGAVSGTCDNVTTTWTKSIHELAVHQMNGTLALADGLRETSGKYTEVCRETWEPSAPAHSDPFIVDGIKAIQAQAGYNLRNEYWPSVEAKLLTQLDEFEYDDDDFSDEEASNGCVTLSLTRPEVYAIEQSLEELASQQWLPNGHSETLRRLATQITDIRNNGADSGDSPLYVTYYYHQQYYGGDEEGGWWGWRVYAIDYAAFSSLGWLFGQKVISDVSELDGVSQQNLAMLRMVMTRMFDEHGAEPGWPEDAKVPTPQELLEVLSQSAYGYTMTSNTYSGTPREYYTIEVERRLNSSQKGFRAHYE